MESVPWRQIGKQEVDLLLEEFIRQPQITGTLRSEADRKGSFTVFEIRAVLAEAPSRRSRWRTDSE